MEYMYNKRVDDPDKKWTYTSENASYSSPGVHLSLEVTIYCC